MDARGARLFFFRHGVVSASVPWIATKNALRRHPPTFDTSETANCNDSVFRAAWNVAAGGRKKRRYVCAVALYRPDEHVVEKGGNLHNPLPFAPFAPHRAAVCYHARLFQRAPHLTNHIVVCGRRHAFFGDKNDVYSHPWRPELAGCGTHDALTATAKGGNTQLLARDERAAPTGKRGRGDDERAVPTRRAPPLFEEALYLLLRFDGAFHEKATARGREIGRGLCAQTLAALGATRLQDSTTTARRHAGAETVALRALALVRLIGTFHLQSSSEKSPSRTDKPENSNSAARARQGEKRGFLAGTSCGKKWRTWKTLYKRSVFGGKLPNVR